MTDTRRDVEAFLGGTAEPTDDEMDRLVDLFDAITARWPDPDDMDERVAALSGAVQVVLGDATLEGVTAEWQRVSLLERERRASWVGAVLASSSGARSGPGSEGDLIARTGAARGTVRKALGR